MVRLTAQLLQGAEQRVNPLGQRELVLSGLGVVVLENLAAVADDQYDAWDLSNNLIDVLDNLPRRGGGGGGSGSGGGGGIGRSGSSNNGCRLRHLQLSNNRIERIDCNNLRTSNIGASLLTLTMSYNNVSSLQQISDLAQACPRLEFLSLLGNPVTRRQHYRLYTIQCFATSPLPSPAGGRKPNKSSSNNSKPNCRLAVLDFVKIKPSERDRASRLAKSAAGAALQQDVAREELEGMTTKTFVPGESATGGDDDGTTRSFVAANFTAEQKVQIRALLGKASSVQEIEMIEQCVRQGRLPPGIAEVSKKRAASDEGDEGDGNAPEDAKKRKVDTDQQAAGAKTSPPPSTVSG